MLDSSVTSGRRRRQGKRHTRHTNGHQNETSKSAEDTTSTVRCATSKSAQNTQRIQPSEADGNESGVLPKGFIWIVWIITLSFRIYIISRKDSGWLVHPDETFQSIEVAHSLVYGYGFRPYEYLPPPNPNTTVAVDRQEAALGMYSLRSMLYPKVFALFLWTAEKCGVQANPFYLCRMFHSFVSAALPLSTYLFMTSLLKPLAIKRPVVRDASIISSIFVAFSQHLTILGTHSLVNSFLAPLIFAILGSFIILLNKLGSYPCRTGDYSNRYSKLDLDSYRNCVSENNNLEEKGVGSTLHQSGGTIHSFTSTKWITVYDVWSVVIGFGFGILVYVRPDTILFICAVCLIVLVPALQSTGLFTCIVFSAKIAVGILLGICVGGLEDYRTYGVYFLSPYQWFNFNVKNSMSSLLFGSKDLSFYTQEIFYKDVFSMTCLALVCAILLYTFYLFMTDGSCHFNVCIKFCISIVPLLYMYSLQKHKEIRFVHNVLVLYCLLIGYSLHVVLKLIRHSNLRAILTYLILFLYILKCYLTLPFPENKGNIEWAYLKNWDASAINECLNYVGQQSDSTGVFLDRSIHVSGGYAVLHKKIPIFSLVHYEFQEFALSSTTKTNDFAWNTDGNIEFTKLNRVSNFITTENTQLLLKYLINQKEYNYWVVRRSREVVQIGFEEVFTSGTMRVMRRTFHHQSEMALQKISESLSMGTNATVLEYEGSWLHTFGLHEKAIERLTVAKSLEKPRARLFQLLALCYSALNQKDKAQIYYEECLELYGNLCSYPQPKVILHDAYRLDLANIT